MSVLKVNRKPSPFEVEHNAYKIRKVITDLSLRKFGLKAYQQKPKPKDYDKWSDNQKLGYEKSMLLKQERYDAFVKWFIPNEQKAILQITRKMIHEIFLANMINPQYVFECNERRLHQDLALGYCENIIQELQYIIESLNVDVEKYETITNLIIKEQALIKGWRKTDNKMRKKIVMRELKEIKNDSKVNSPSVIIAIFNLIKTIYNSDSIINVDDETDCN